MAIRATNKRGGPPKTFTPTTGSQSLLNAIINRYGGVTEFFEVLSEFAVTRQQVNNWRKRGSVPVRKAMRIAVKLNISPYALNYDDVCQVTGRYPGWEEVVKSCKWLSKERQKRILARPVPASWRNNG